MTMFALLVETCIGYWVSGERLRLTFLSRFQRFVYLFTVLPRSARCTLGQSAVLRSHVVCLSVCLSVRPFVCNVGGLWSHRLELFRNNFTISFSLGCSLSADPNITSLLQGEHPEIWAQSDPPPLIWASETFDRKLRPNGYRQRNDHNGEPIGNYYRSFEWCDRWPPTTSPSPKMGVPYDPRYANGHISTTAHSIHLYSAHSAVIFAIAQLSCYI